MLVYCSPAAYATRAAGAAPMQEVFLRSKADGHETRMFFERVSNHPAPVAYVERPTQDLQLAC
ncbi:MAG TPA: hypothetical protein VN950_01280 [Terriglobales bacterium]|nr:hypothetical protein [Terriglobales bacterium]